MASTENVYSLVGKNLKLTSEEDIAPYLEEIKSIENLQEIHLGGNTFGIGACKALGEVLKTKKTLQVADFADIFTARTIDEIPDALRALCDSLVEHESLVEIDLSDNAFGGRSAEPMVNFLTNNHHFSILKLNNNGLGVTGGKIVADALLEAGLELQKQNKTSKLQTLICGRNRLEDGSAPHWSKAFATHKSLQEVRMFQNGIRMDGIVSIAQGLAECKQLKVLDLQDNTATIPGSRGIAAALPNWPDLETLNLADCLLKPKGGNIIFDVLYKGSNKNLKTLQLQYCDLDRKALDRLGNAIDSGALANVEKLEINGNWADEDDECITKIKSALEKHGHEDALDELDEMDPEGEDEDAEEEDDEEDDEEEEEEKEKKPEAAEIAAAAIAAPAATAAVIGGVAANAASGAKDTVSNQMQNLSVQDEESNTKSASASETAAAVVAAPAATAAVVSEAATNAVSNTKDVISDKLQSNTTEPEKTVEEQNEQQKSNVIAEAQDAEKIVNETDANEKTATQPPPILGETQESSKTVTSESAATEPAENKNEKATDLAAGGAVLAGAAGTVGAVVAGVTGQEGNAAEKVEETEKTTVNNVTPVQPQQEAAETAAEVAQSAQEVPEEKEAAETADEVAESAREVPDDKVAAETADEVAEVAKQVPEKISGQSTPAAVVPAENNSIQQAEVIPAAAAIASTPAPVASSEAAAALPQADTSVKAAPAATENVDKSVSGHGKQGSVDLSGELYGNEQAAGVTQPADVPAEESSTSASGSTSLPPSTSTNTLDQNKPKKKGGFRAAFGAIRELLR